MRHIESAFLAAASLLLLFGPAATQGATRPHYGGTLRVEMRERVTSLDPRQWPQDSVVAAATEKLAELVFESPVTLDDNVSPRQQLSVSLENGTEMKRWKLTQRSGEKFQNEASSTHTNT